MAEMFKVNAPVRKPLFEGVQGENEARSIVFDITPWVDELGDGAVTATAKRSQDSQPYPVTVTKDGTTVTWKPTSTDTAFAGVGSFQLEYTVGGVLAKTCIWSTMVAPSLDPAGDPPDPYENWLAEMRQVAADALQSEQNAEGSAENAEAWAVGQRGGVDVPSTDPTYENNAKYYAEQSAANQYGAYIVKSAEGNIASFNDGADDIPMKSLNVTITPQQAGSGDPSPSNVRPITGTSTANVFVKPLNLFPNTLGVQSVTKNGVTFDITEENGFITDIYMHGTATAATSLALANESHPFNLPAGSLKMYLGGDRTASGSRFDINIRRAGSTRDIVATTVAVNITNTEPTQFTSAYIWVYSGAVLNHHVMPCIVKDGVDITGYPNYPIHNGHTTTVPLGQTVYGGTLDVTTGVLTVTHKIFAIYADWNWVKSSTYPGGFYASVLSVMGFKANTPVVCSHAKTANTISEYVQDTCYVDGSLNIRIMNADSTVDDWKNYIISERSAGREITVCGKLATPTTVQLTPAQVATLLGTNNVWADCGSVEVEYRADPTLAYNELANVIVSLGGNI